MLVPWGNCLSVSLSLSFSLLPADSACKILWTFVKHRHARAILAPIFVMPAYWIIVITKKWNNKEYKLSMPKRTNNSSIATWHQVWQTYEHVWNMESPHRVKWLGIRNFRFVVLFGIWTCKATPRARVWPYVRDAHVLKKLPARRGSCKECIIASRKHHQHTTLNITSAHFLASQDKNIKNRFPADQRAIADISRTLGQNIVVAKSDHHRRTACHICRNA